jgi:hypothetical protein
MHINLDGAVPLIIMSHDICCSYDCPVKVNFEMSLEPSSSSLFCPLSTRDPTAKGVCQGDYCIWLGTSKSVNSVCITAE